MINTVTGAIAGEQLGKTLMHEHIIFGYPGYQGDITHGGWNKDNALSEIEQHLTAAKSHGVQTIVDATPNECGRNPEFLKEVSERFDIQLICSTGFYYEGEGGSAYFKMRSGLTDISKEIYDMMKTEIEVGIGGTGIKAGVIKLASSKDQITDYERIFFTVAARVAQETGVPIITHTQEGTMGPDQAKLLTELGVNPNRIMIGHMDGNTSIDYHEETFSYGVHIAFDRCGLQMIGGMPMDSDRIQLFSQLVAKGYADRLHLSHDFILHWLGRPIPATPEVQAILQFYHLSNVFENIMPGLKEKGVTDDQLHQIMHDNPISLFEG